MDQRRAAAALLALAACIACSTAAPTASDHTALELKDGSIEGCYYNFQHYGEGDRIMTNEPCLNCTCHNRMLMCYLRVCPFTKAIGQDCTVEKRADQCCPIVTCPDVPVDLLTSTSTSSPAEYGSTGLGKLDKYGCSIHGKYFPEGSKVPSTPNKPCEHCYCIRNMTTCVMQECTLHVDGCTPIYHKDVCCPVRYSCDHPEDEVLLLDDMTTTVRPTPGFLLTTTTMVPVTQVSQDCVHDDQVFPDGALIKTEKACEHCYCMKGDIVCVVQECGTPMENEGKNCTSLPPRPGQCCPDTYICEGDEPIVDLTTEFVESITLPPRRLGDEGSGYRNEPDEHFTEHIPITTEVEGSGEEFVTTEKDLTSENAQPEIVDDQLLTTTETLQLSKSTEPDKGENTIPDSALDKETAPEPTQSKVTTSDTDASIAIIEEYTTPSEPMSQKDEVATESTVNKDDENVSDVIPTQTEFEKEITTESTDLLGKTTLMDDISNILETTKMDQKASTITSAEPINIAQETPHPQEIGSETSTQPSVSGKEKVADETLPATETETSIELTSTSYASVSSTDATTVNPNINDVDDNVSPVLSPSRIPGEGDCLLNGITYTNNSNVPSTNKCHIGCKCFSSIIKCDPIICNPPSEYLENISDCQSVYDTPDSCCPTYVCNVKETTLPQSHSQMSGTESPKPLISHDCSGKDCIISEEKQSSASPSPDKVCGSNDCKDEVPAGTLKPTQECSDETCHESPIAPCQGKDCVTEPSNEIIPEKGTEHILHDVSHICEEENGCKSDNNVNQDECSGEKCEKKEQTQLKETLPPVCLGLECKLDNEETTIGIKEETPDDEDKKAEPVDSDIKTTEIMSDMTTSKDKLTEFHKEMTDIPEKLFAVSEQPTDDTRKQYDADKESTKTDSPLVQITTSLPEEIITDRQYTQSESTKMSDIDSEYEHKTQTDKILLQENLTPTESILFNTEIPKKAEGENEKSITDKKEQLTTEKAHSYTESNVYDTVSNEEYTKLPETIVTELEKSTTESSENINADNLTKSPEVFTDYQVVKTTSPEVLISEKEPTQASITLLDISQTEIPEDKEKIQTTIIEGITEKTIAPEVTKEESISLTGVTNTYAQDEDTQTKVPETVTISKEIHPTDIPGGISLTETSEVSLTETLPNQPTEETYIERQTTTPTELAGTSKEIIQTEIKELLVTEKQPIQNDLSGDLYTTKADIPVTTPITAIGEKDENTVSLDHHEIKLDDTVQTSTEKLATSSVEVESEKTESFTFTEQQTTITEKNEKSEEDVKVYDEFQKPIKPKEVTTNDATEVTTERLESYTQHDYVNKIMTDGDTMATPLEPHVTIVSDTIKDTTKLSEIDTILGEVTTIKSEEGPTESHEIYTKPVQNYVTISEGKESTAYDNMLYTTSSTLFETKSDDASIGEDHISEKETVPTKAPEIAQRTETTTINENLVTGQHVDDSLEDIKTTSLPVHDVPEEHEVYTDIPEIQSTMSQISDRTTKQSDSQVTPGEEVPIAHTTEKQIVAETTVTFKEYDDEKDIIVSPEVTPLETLYELTTTAKVTNEEHDVSDAKTTQPEELERASSTSGMDTESSTDSLDVRPSVTKTDDEYPVVIEDKQQETTSIAPEKDVHMETSFPMKDITQGDLITQSPSQLFTTQQQDKSEEDNVVSTNEVEFITKSVEESSETQTSPNEQQETEVDKKIPEEQTTVRPKIELISEKTEKEEFISTTQTPVYETITQKEERVTPYIKEEETPKPSDSEGTTLVIDDLGGLAPISDVTAKEKVEISTEISLPTTKEYPTSEQETVMSSKSPEPSISQEQSTIKLTDEEPTTEAYFTGDENKESLFTTHVYDNKDKQPDQKYFDESNIDSSSTKPDNYNKITDLPMAIVTNMDNEPTTQSIIPNMEDKLTQEITETPDKYSMEKEEKPSTTSDSSITKLQPTDSPQLLVTLKELETEISSRPSDLDKSHISDMEHVEKTIPPILEDELNVEQKTTVSTVHQTETTEDKNIIPITEAINTENTPASVNDFATVEKITSSPLPPTEKEIDLSQKEGQTSTDENITKSPNKELFDENEKVESTTVFMEIDREIKPTHAIVTEDHVFVTEYPEAHVYNTQTTASVKETSEIITVEVTDTPDLSTETKVVPTIPDKESDVTELTATEVPENAKTSTETLIVLGDKMTTPVDLELFTEEDIKYTEKEQIPETTKEQYIGQENENTEVVGVPTKVYDQVASSTESSATDYLEHDKHHDVTVDLVKETQTPELNTLVTVTESQTDLPGTEKVTSAEPITKIETFETLVTEKEIQNISEVSSSPSSTQEEVVSTESTKELNIQTEKTETGDMYITTEITHTTESIDNLTTRKPYVSEEQEATTKSIHGSILIETTPFLVELEEHPHGTKDESSHISTEDMITTVGYEPQDPERGDQNLDTSEKSEQESITLLPTEYDYGDKEKKVPTTSQDKEVTDISIKTEIVPTTSPKYTELDIQVQETKSTTIDQDVVVSTASSLETTSEKEKESLTTIPETENVTYPVQGTSVALTEKEIYATTEVPMKAEDSIATTSPEDDILKEISKTTASTIEHESSSHSPSTIDKSSQPEDKPATTISPAQEVIKPGEDISEEVPSPDFPPSGSAGYGQEPDYIEEDQTFGPGTCRYGGKVYVSAQQIPRDDPCDFCFCFRSDIICLQQSCPPPIHGCHEEPIQGFCCPRYECPVSMATTVNVTTTTTTTTTTLPPHFFPHAYKGAAQRRGCQIKGHTYKVGDVVRASSGPCLHCTCGGDGQMKCDPKACTPEPMLRQMIAAAVSAKRRR